MTPNFIRLLEIKYFFYIYIIGIGIVTCSSRYAQNSANSITQLLPYSNDNNVNVKLSPGTFTITRIETSTDGSGDFQLVKPNASEFTLNTGSNESNSQNINPYNTANTSQNLQCIITPKGESVKTPEVYNDITVVLYPNQLYIPLRLRELWIA